MERADAASFTLGWSASHLLLKPPKPSDLTQLSFGFFCLITTVTASVIWPSPVCLSLRALCVLVCWLSVHRSPVSISYSHVVMVLRNSKTHRFDRQQLHIHFSKYFKWLCLTIFHGILLGKKNRQGTSEHLWWTSCSGT